MKKIYSLLLAFVLFMFPFAALAAVNVTLMDESTPGSNSIAINIDTQTDVLSTVALPIRHSEGVTILDITEGDIECSSLDYTQSIEDTILVTCELESPMALDGVLANIAFSSDESFSFEISDNEDLDLGGLLLGESTGIDEDIQEDDFDVNILEEDNQEEVEFEEEMVVTTQEDPLAPPPMEEDGIMESIMEYLPYILIGASALLLISIVVILLGKKKKDPKAPPKKTDSSKKKDTEKAPEDKGEPTLKSMVNNVGDTPQPQQPQPAQPQPQQPQQPQPQQPQPQQPQPQQPQPQQPQPQQPQPQQPQPQQPQPQQPTPETTPPPPQNFSPANEKDDLEEILQRESSAPPTDQAPAAPPEPQQVTGGPTAVESLETVMPDTPQPDSPEVTENDYPPVPPTAAQNPQPQPQSPPVASEQPATPGQPTAPTTEEGSGDIPEVPPTM